LQIAIQNWEPREPEGNTICSLNGLEKYDIEVIRPILGQKSDKNRGRNSLDAYRQNNRHTFSKLDLLA